MTTTTVKRLFFAILLFITIHSIYGRRLNDQIDTEDQSLTNDDELLHDRMDIRSVLWPKICFKTLVKRDTDDYPSDEYQLRIYRRGIAKRNPRKCYPFDTT